jgi:hypothetical protein
MSDEFLDAIMNRTGSAGFDIQYSNKYARPTLEKLAADVRSKMDIASKTDRPAKKERKVNQRSQIVKLTPEEQAYKDYDDARQKLTTFLGETLNTPKGISDGNAALTEIVNSVSRGRREQQYAAPATSTPESPVPATAPVPAAAPQDDIRSMIEATGNALSSEPVADEQPATAPMGNVSTEIGAPKAAPAAAPEISEDRMSALFRKTMGTAFDPKSKMDIGKMNQLREFVGGNPDLLNKSDTKIALDYYRTLK